MSEKPFDLDAFMKAMQDLDPAIIKKEMDASMQEEMSSAIQEVPPRIWSILSAQMSKDPTNGIYLNAILDAAILAVLTWVTACTPPGTSSGVSNDEILRKKVSAELEFALKTSRRDGPRMIMAARRAGAEKLLEDALGVVSAKLNRTERTLEQILTFIKQNGENK